MSDSHRTKLILAIYLPLSIHCTGSHDMLHPALHKQ